ncbi:Undecaprenyl pyrophosphate synthetase [Thermanaeromonas toyohensis ToBE]|uniref:Isoprenyl transferase n=2 Tax=Thermanaeromonas TaxID=202949 RepID=A0A1W1VRF9_9FIRM|nr:Undecaprenyl pyrophosphate synthetase [Thermanaeromonas toyohensis ToBE]
MPEAFFPWLHKRRMTQRWKLPPRDRLPRHLAIIMDGNGRWALRRGLPRVAGHRAGVEALRETVKACLEWGIEILTVYAFSTENWKRPREEVDTLMELLVEYLRKEVKELNQQGVRIGAIGRLHELPIEAQQELARARELTAGNQRLLLNLALNYGGRAELVDACCAVAQDILQGKLKLEQIDEEVLSRYLYTAGLPDPDLLIRTAGEMRFSNFLLWQSAYTELWVTPILWPDFRREDLLVALHDYARRERRFGGLK